ncbi:MAG TPA: hypothetical protein VKB86_02655 [Pyrinomonadaceae bacterium]|nr:hypothetical protein [Pyrinomonadaceae bacterium]
MSMEDFHCDMVGFDIRFSLEDFDKEALIKDVDAKEMPDSVYSWSYGSVEKPDEQHASISIKLTENENCRLSLLYIKSERKVQDIRPPYMEDCAQWIGQFFKTDDMPADVQVVYIFDISYSPIFALPFPLITENKELSGTQVTGVSLILPKRAGLERVMIQKGTDSVFLAGTAKTKVNLKSFDLNAQLGKMSSLVMKLLKKEGE